MMTAEKKDARPGRAVRKRTPSYVKNLRGVKNWKEAKEWLSWRSIEDIECITPDLAGVPRGKMMPSSKFTNETSLALPNAVFRQTISGDYPAESGDFRHDPLDSDLKLVPDLSTLSAVPWETDPTAQVICDIVGINGKAIAYTPRNLLRNVMALYDAKGWKAVVAPEIEFYLVAQNIDPDYPLQPPKGRSGRSISGGQAYSIAGVNEFDELIDDIYHFSEKQGLEIDTLIHEEGPSQLEINLRHGDPLQLADQVFLFKRTIREAAMAHSMYATFMAKPIQGLPGSAMHIHQSIVNKKTGRNIFTDEETGAETPEFFHFIGGMQRYVPALLVMLAPYVNSYRRLTPGMSAPVNTAWGYDNRTTAFRVPPSSPAARRVENRLPSSDANPYLALGASLAAGYLGMVNKIKPSEPSTVNTYGAGVQLPRGLLDGVALLESEPELEKIFGPEFIAIYSGVKRGEFETFMQVISPWEREYLLLNV